MKCPECGNELEDNVRICPNCGFEIRVFDKAIQKNTAIKSVISGNRRIVGIVLCVLALGLIFGGFKTIQNDEYIFYKQHYQECMDGYADTKAEGESYANAYFKSTYNDLADEYEKMAQGDSKKIRRYQFQAGVFYLGGIVLGGAGCYLIIKRKKANGVDKVS